MNTQISIDVNGDPRQILECAYRTLLSMGSIVGDTNPTIDHHLLFANICIQKRYVRKYDFSQITAKRNYASYYIAKEISLSRQHKRNNMRHTEIGHHLAGHA